MFDAIIKFYQSTGLYALFTNPDYDYRTLIMIAISCLLLYLAIKKGFEPLLLIPIAFGMLLANLPLAELTIKPVIKLFYEGTTPVASYLNVDAGIVGGSLDHVKVGLDSAGGLMHYLLQGVKLGIFPPLIFLGVGAMTDFGPLIANPKALLLGAAAQLGIFFTFLGALLLGFNAQEAASIGIIGGADGPTAIFLTSKLAPHLLGAIAVAAYSYMALVPVIQPPIMMALTTKKERMIKMDQLRNVSKTEKIIFPVMVTIAVSLIVPPAAALVGFLMLGNLFKECGVTARLEDTSKNALINIITIFLGISVGATATAESFLNAQTLKIIVLGVTAFGVGTAGGILLGKLMNWQSGGRINPLIGSAGVSAVPMAARVSQVVGQKENPSNFLLMHAMGPNVAGVIGSAVAAGVLLTLFQQ